MSVTSPSQKGGIVVININGTITFFPRVHYTGIYGFTTSDGEGNLIRQKYQLQSMHHHHLQAGQLQTIKSRYSREPKDTVEVNGEGFNLYTEIKRINTLAIQMNI